MLKLMPVTHKDGKLAWHSVEQALGYVNAYGRRSSTEAERLAVAQYMVKHQTAVFHAEAQVLNIEDLSGQPGLQMSGRILG